MRQERVDDESARSSVPRIDSRKAKKATGEEAGANQQDQGHRHLEGCQELPHVLSPATAGLIASRFSKGFVDSVVRRSSRRDQPEDHCTQEGESDGKREYRAVHAHIG